MELLTLLTFFCAKAMVYSLLAKVARMPEPLLFTYEPAHDKTYKIACAPSEDSVVPVLVLLFVALWFILRGDLFYVLPCVILFLCFSVLLALRLPCLGKRERFSYVRTFVRFVLVWFCRFPLLLGVWEGLRFVIVASPGLFSYPFFQISLGIWPV